MRGTTLAVRFLLELGSLAALAIWGWRVGGPVVAVAVPGVAAFVWGRFVAPNAPHRLSDPAKLGLEVVVFGSAVAGIVASGSARLAAGFAAVVIADLILMFVLDARDA